VAPHGEVTYTKHIAGILQNNCVECHRTGEVAPFPLTSYDEVVGWADMICEVVREGRMPPWFADPAHGKFANDCRLSEEEKALIQTWAKNGCPEGDPSDLPPPREFAQGWRIGQPDLVVYMSEEPHTVQAEGTAPYEMFEVDPGFTEDKWIQAAESRPGNPAVVHHIIVFVIEPNSGDRFGQGAQMGYAPGMPPRIFEPGMALKIPAGSKLMFQMHYTPNGVEQQDRSYVGFKFADPKTVTRQVRGAVSGNFTFKIPAGDGNYQVTSRRRFRKDTLLLAMLPHMHVRGKDFRIDLEYPDGKREVLLDVPRWDFNWQIDYILAKPKLMPKGSKLYCEAHYDNSADSPTNPDPTKTIRFGEQTWDEMMIGWFTTATLPGQLSNPAAAVDSQTTEAKTSQTSPAPLR